PLGVFLQNGGGDLLAFGFRFPVPPFQLVLVDLQESGVLDSIPTEVGHPVHRPGDTVAAETMLEVGHKHAGWPVVFVSSVLVVERESTATVELVGVLVVRLEPAPQ